MRAIAPRLLVLSVLPRVEDPWPEVIGIDFPFTIAGSFGLLAGFLYAESPETERDKGTRKGGFLGFCLGALFYSLSLLNQIFSGL